jgi:YVTN family beta-propeller protein
MRALRVLVCLYALVWAASSVVAAKTNYAYVANYGVDNVSAINLKTNAVVGTITVGANPFAVAVDQAGKFAYVTNYGSGSVSVISTSNNTVVATIPVGSGPDGIVLSPNGKTVYVANGLSATVSVINTATHKVSSTIPVGTFPEGMAELSNGAFVYVPNAGSNTVSVISTLKNAVVSTIPVGLYPTWVAVSPDNFTAYVANYSANSVSVIRTTDNAVVNTISIAAPGPYADAVSPDGHWLYVGSDGTTTVIDTRTLGAVATIPTAAGTTSVLSFTQDSGFAYVAEPSIESVAVISTATRTIVATVPVGPSPAGVAVMGTVKVSTVAGGYVGDGGPATQAALDAPYYSIFDKAGNFYVSDPYMNRVRKVDTAGNITTYVGTGVAAYNGDGINASKAAVSFPEGIAFDSKGNMILSDGGNSRIRKITSAGKISTIVGTGAFGNSGDGGSALQAQIGQPDFPLYDSAHNLYFSDVATCVVRKVDTSGTITRVAGTGACGYNGEGTATLAQLNQPTGMVFDKSGNLYISDTANFRIRKIDPSGNISTFAGTGSPGFSGDGGPATSADINTPRGLAIRSGLLYLTNGGRCRVRTVNLKTNIINTYAGFSCGYDGDNNALLATDFLTPHDSTFDPLGNPIFDDAGNGRVRMATGGIVHTIAGGFLGDGGKATAASLLYPAALAIDQSGNLYIADSNGNRVRKVTAGNISTIAGTGVSGYSGDGGPGNLATLYQPQGVALDSAGNVFIADTFNGVIREVKTDGKIYPFASNPNFNYLLQMATDSSNNLYVADNGACVIWKITPASVVSIAAGVLNTCGYNGDGIPATSAQLAYPYSVTVDLQGSLLIADWGNNRLRKVKSSGTISTVAGDGTCNYTGDGGPATAAELCPNSVAVDPSGAIYVADFTWERIRKIKGGVITALAGSAFGFNGDGMWPLYTNLTSPIAVAVDAGGAVYEVDNYDRRVRKIQ